MKTIIKKELVLASFGLYPGQITLETMTALKKCQKVYFTCLRRRDSGLMLSLFPEGEILEGVPFEELVSKVEGAFSAYERVGVVDYGDPAFLCVFFDRLRQAARRRRVPVREYRAISSLNTILAEFGLGGLDSGGLYLATPHSWAAGKTSPAVPVLVFCADRSQLGGDREGALAGLIADILAVYPPGHVVWFIRCRGSGAGVTEKRAVKVSALKTAAAGIKFDTTIYIPPVAEKPGKR